MNRAPWLLAYLFLCAITAPAAAQSGEVALEKLTNGQDADLPPGPSLHIGDPVAWTYVVTASGSRDLENVAVTDDQGVTVTCPSATLLAGKSVTCTGQGFAVAGQYANLGTVTADIGGGVTVSTSDPSHYFGFAVDFGDAAAPPYPTLLAADGARHLLANGVYLGACADSELDGQPGAGADGDDLGSGTTLLGTCAVAGDDEDGVTFTTPLVAGTTAGADVVAAAGCTLSAWIDWNRDGDWSDAGEDLFPGGTALAAGTNPLTFPVPASVVTGTGTARFRCTTAGAVSFTGEAPDGEVEDYTVTLASTAQAAAEIPTLGTWGLLALLLFLGGFGVWRLRRSRPGARSRRPAAAPGG